MSESIKILVYGLGAIGGLYAYILGISPQVQLTVVARSNYDAVKEHGIKVESKIYGTQVFRPHSIIKSLSEAQGPYDFIVFAHKALGPASVPKDLASIITPKTTIIIMQNGVGNEDPFRALLPDTTIVITALWVSAHQHTLGVITHTATIQTPLGILSSPSTSPSSEAQSQLKTFASLLEAGKMPAPTYSSSEIQTQRWEKLTWNAAFNSFTALTGLNTLTWLKSSEPAISITRRLMREIMEVARAEGVSLRKDLDELLVERSLGLPPVYSSMQLDIEKNRPLEVDAIFGSVAAKARARGVQIPTLEVIYALLNGINSRIEAGNTA